MTEKEKWDKWYDKHIEEVYRPLVEELVKLGSIVDQICQEEKS